MNKPRALTSALMTVALVALAACSRETPPAPTATPATPPAATIPQPASTTPASNAPVVPVPASESAATAKADAANAAVQDWERLMSTFQRALPWSAEGQKWVPMQRIFSLQDPH